MYLRARLSIHVYATLVRLSMGVKSVNEPVALASEWVDSLSKWVESVSEWVESVSEGAPLSQLSEG